VVRGDSMPEPVPALHILASLDESLQYSLGLPSADGQVCLPQQWLRDWLTQAQVALALLDPMCSYQDNPDDKERR
jgi:hypothetical protein